MLVEPFVKVSAGSATCDDLVAHFVQALTYCGADAAHAACDVSNFLTHLISFWWVLKMYFTMLWP
jgi:hypothetical protein